MNVLGIVAARGGSKGFPGKNKAPFLGEPLVVRATRTLAQSTYVQDVVISTDDQGIADLAVLAGARFLGIRPDSLAIDTAPLLPVLRYEMLQAQEIMAHDFDAIVLASPTSPLRRTKHINEAIDLLRQNKKADCVVSVCKTPHQFSIESQLIVGSDGFAAPLIPGGDRVLRRQDKTASFARNGPCVLVLRKEFLLECENFYSGNTILYPMQEIYGLDIDCEADLRKAEAYVSSALVLVD